MALLLAGCTDDETGGADPQPTAGDDPQVQLLAPDATAPAPAVSGATPGGDITVLSSSVPASLDPTRAGSPAEWAILQLVTRSLTQYRYDPATGRSVLVPDMATDLGRPNDDFTAWTFTLRRGLRYADGTRVVAADVAYAVKRSFAEDLLPGGAPYNRLFFLDGQQYEGPYDDGLDYAGVEVDGRTITLRMARPFTDLPYYAALPAFTAIPPSADRNPQRYGRRPMATGPYQFAAYDPGDELVLTRNEHWDPDTDPARHQYADTWTFEWGVDAARRDTELVQDDGLGATTASYDSVLADTYALVQQDADLMDRMVTGNAPCASVWYLDTDAMPSRQVRRAVGYAYPYREVWRAEGGLEGVTRLPASTLLPPGTIGRLPYDPLGIDGANTHAERARELLAQAGELGRRIRFFYATDDPTSVAVKDVLVAGFERAGFRAVPVPSTVNGRTRDEADPRSRVDVRSVRWCSAWPTGSAWFPAQWQGEQLGPGAPAPPFLDDPVVDRRITEILETMGPERSRRAWGELDRYVQSSAYPVVPVGYEGRASMFGSRIGGMAVNEVYGMPTFVDMYVRPEEE